MPQPKAQAQSAVEASRVVVGPDSERVSSLSAPACTPGLCLVLQQTGLTRPPACLPAAVLLPTPGKEVLEAPRAPGGRSSRRCCPAPCPAMPVMNSPACSLPRPPLTRSRRLQGCNRSFAELWRLKVHYRAPPDVRGSGKERGHGTELKWCPKCGKDLKPGKHHVGCSAGKSAPRQAAKRQRQVRRRPGAWSSGVAAARHGGPALPRSSTACCRPALRLRSSQHYLLTLPLAPAAANVHNHGERMGQQRPQRQPGGGCEAASHSAAASAAV